MDSNDSQMIKSINDLTKMSSLNQQLKGEQQGSQHNNGEPVVECHNHNNANILEAFIQTVHQSGHDIDQLQAQPKLNLMAELFESEDEDDNSEVN